MATNLSVSMARSSDDVHEMFCEECDKHESKYVPAEGFCTECLEYKCIECLKYHRRLLKKPHNIQDKNSMPQDFYTEKCSRHPKQVIKYYCFNCEAESCQECKDNDHPSCGQVKHLPTFVKDIQHSKMLKDLKESLDAASKDIEETDKLIDCKSEKIAKQETEAIDTCRKHKHKLIDAYKKHYKKTIDDFDEETEEIIARRKEERKKLVKKIAEKETGFEKKVSKAENDIEKSIENTNIDYKENKKEYDILVKDLKAMSTELSQSEDLNQKCKLFLNMKKTEKLIKNLGKNIEKLKSNKETCTKIYFNKPMDTNEALEGSETFFSLEEIPQSAKVRKASFDPEQDSKLQGFTNLCLLTKTTLIAADFDICSLGILKISRADINLIHEKQLSSGPLAIAKVSRKRIAVTFPEIFTIKMVTVSDSTELEITDQIAVRSACYGIAFCQEKLIVSFINPGSVDILDMSGMVLASFNTDSTGNPLFVCPFNLALSPDRKTIYVSDMGMSKVTSMTFDGKVKATYMDDNLQQPCQMTVDGYGSIYVCGRLSHNIHQLSQNFAKLNVLSDQALDEPVGVAYCKETHKLYVEISDCNITILDLSTRKLLTNFQSFYFQTSPEALDNQSSDRPVRSKSLKL